MTDFDANIETTGTRRTKAWHRTLASKRRMSINFCQQNLTATSSRHVPAIDVVRSCVSFGLICFCSNEISRRDQTVSTETQRTAAKSNNPQHVVQIGRRWPSGVNKRRKDLRIRERKKLRKLLQPTVLLTTLNVPSLKMTTLSSIEWGAALVLYSPSVILRSARLRNRLLSVSVYEQAKLAAHKIVLKRPHADHVAIQETTSLAQQAAQCSLRPQSPKILFVAVALAETARAIKNLENRPQIE